MFKYLILLTSLAFSCRDASSHTSASKGSDIKVPVNFEIVHKDEISIVEGPNRTVVKDTVENKKIESIYVSKSETIDQKDQLESELGPTYMEVSPFIGQERPTKEVRQVVVDDVEKLDATSSDDLDLKESVHPLQQLTGPDHTHQKFNHMLAKYVAENGLVDYASWKSQIQDLKDYLDNLASHGPEEGWSNSQKLAYWINAYNALTIYTVLEAYPIKSIKDLNQGKVWDVENWSVSGQTYSLNKIEHDIIRPRFKDARIHFAVNCAAYSCPPLWNQAWTAATLEEDLDHRTRSFINHPSFNTWTSEKAELSQLFKWYAEDFGEIPSYVNRYAVKPLDDNASIAFLTYDWRLNAQ